MDTRGRQRQPRDLLSLEYQLYILEPQDRQDSLLESSSFGDRLYSLTLVREKHRRTNKAHDSPHPSRDPWLQGDQISLPVGVILVSCSCCSAQYSAAELPSL
jgi:hypothetical protein